MLLQGAIDLSQSLDMPTQTQHPSMREALRRIAAACAARGVSFCAIPRVEGQHESWCQAGVKASLLGTTGTWTRVP